MTKMTIYILGSVALIVLLVWGVLSILPDKDAGTAVSVDSVVSVAEDFYDFGTIDIFGGKVQTTYMLINEGAQDVLITSAFTSCMCTEGQIGDLSFGMHESTGTTVVIPAGAEKVLTALFDPLAHGPNGVGKIKRELVLKTNSTATPEVKLTFTGDVIKNEN